MKVAPQEQQALARIAAHLAAVAQCEVLVLPSERMDDGRALPIEIPKLGGPEMAWTQVATLLCRPQLACLDGHMLACPQDPLQLRPQGLLACSRIGTPCRRCAGDGLLRASERCEMVAATGRDVEKRRHAALSAVKCEAAGLTEAAEALPRHPPATAALEAVLFRDVGERRVLRLDHRPVELGVVRVSLILVETIYITTISLIFM